MSDDSRRDSAATMLMCLDNEQHCDDARAPGPYLIEGVEVKPKESNESSSPYKQPDDESGDRRALAQTGTNNNTESRDRRALALTGTN
ncbi:hypothetical protein THAOC_35512 [Thalassiosira oceanica]|uniref:Uncharacterized protein n=1 Tax=Thalassiosira oceanica TaxID=159749 RepID=K0R1M7_THAOC|nr:hypothetical protein THAOC_35512 [Thalassiosira oceanica]|eukprot:EJK45850.1 hypothetical protein THAOC_35512 [Thalassiosira oceanica]